MAYEQFIPELWASDVITSLQKSLVFGSVANRNYEGEITDAGSVVKINYLGDVTISNYDPDTTTLTYPSLDDAQRELKVNQVKSFSFGVPDIAAAQAKPETRAKAMVNAAYGLKNAADSYIAGLYTEAGIVDSLGTEATAIDITSVNITEYVGLIGQKMDENNVPDMGRWLIAPPWFIQKLVLAKIVLDTNNSEILSSGYMGRYLGFDIYKSNNVSVKTAATNQGSRILAGVSDSITMAEQILKMETLRLETKFTDGIRGLYVYGAKVVRPETLACLRADYTDEP
jgi:hypothetical protein